MDAGNWALNPRYYHLWQSSDHPEKDAFFLRKK